MAGEPVNRNSGFTSVAPFALRLAAMWMSSHRTHEPSLRLMTLLLSDQRETCCYSWHGMMPSHSLAMRPSLGHRAPGSLSQGRTFRSFVLRFCQSSRRSLGRRLLLRQRISMTLLLPYTGRPDIHHTSLRMRGYEEIPLVVSRVDQLGMDLGRV